MTPTLLTLCSSLPPEGVRASLGAARQEVLMTPTLLTSCSSLPPEGARAFLGTARQKAH
jgi:hypothetical protein